VSDAGGFLIEKAKERRSHFLRKRRWLLLACVFFPAAVTIAVALIYRNPLAGWVNRGELTAFWIGVGVVGTAWWISTLLGLDGGRNLRQGAEAEKWTAHTLRPLRKRGWSVFHDIQLEGRNIDHAIIGSNGAVAVETKWTDDELQVDSSGIRKVGLDGNLYRHNGLVSDAERHARDLRLLLRAGGVRTAVMPVLVLWGGRLAPLEGGARWVGHTLVCLGGEAGHWLDALVSQPLSKQEIALACDAIRSRKEGRVVRAERVCNAPVRDGMPADHEATEPVPAVSV
jgi:hypothetical protein